MPCYALRQLNPFSGVVQVVETDSARAFSHNGVLWRLQVLAERPEHTWRSTGQQLQRQFFNWAMWSADEGLRQVSANPLLDIGAMQAAADTLIEELQLRQLELPFGLADRFEYWACDYQGRPVALIASTAEAVHACGSPDTAWHATAISDHGFISDTLLTAGLENNDGYCPRLHAERLESEVRHRAQARFWFERDNDGGSRRLDKEQVIDGTLFPSYGLETEWSDPLVAGLVADYIRWIAPLLLLLPVRDPARRRQLEQQARIRAELVADLYRLYPRIIQTDLIEQARVEARLRRA